MAGSTRWIRIPVVAVLFTAACAGGSSVAPTSEPPPDVPPPAASVGYVWGHVVKDSGVCIPGAVVLILEGPGAGRSSLQDQPCDAWSYDAGFEFRDLPMGAHLKVRATAEGYQAQERDIYVGNGGPAVQFELEPD